MEVMVEVVEREKMFNDRIYAPPRMLRHNEPEIESCLVHKPKTNSVSQTQKYANLLESIRT
jgi:hypothetical protein